jgi:hypothetical protein
MRLTPPFLAAAASALIGSFLCWCETIVPRSERSASAPLAVVPQTFLYNSYKPLNQWLDTPVEVYMADVPLKDVFAEPVFADLNYRMIDIPDTKRFVNAESIGITRRQLLWSIAHEHGLRMRARLGGEEGDSYIEITGRSRSDGGDRT